jgi:hypothetical protein
LARYRRLIISTTAETTGTWLETELAAVGFADAVETGKYRLDAGRRVGREPVRQIR